MIYLASPYSHPSPMVREARYRNAVRATAYLMRRGSIVFSPIAYGHQFAVAEGLGTSAEDWQAFNQAMLDASTELFVLKLTGWADSLGVRTEIEYAKENNMPIAWFDMLREDFPQ